MGVTAQQHPCWFVECDNCHDGDNTEYGGSFHYDSFEDAKKSVTDMDWVVEDGFWLCASCADGAAVEEVRCPECNAEPNKSCTGITFEGHQFYGTHRERALAFIEHAQTRRDRNDMAFWFPRIEAAGLPVPETVMVKTDSKLWQLLDGEMPDGYEEFIQEMRAAVRQIGGAVFLRTGHGSGKHDWQRTCHLQLGADSNMISAHVCALIEWSALTDLPAQTWAVRRMLEVNPICVCEGYGRMPVVREFRLFVRDGEIEHVQPYWPALAVEKGRPNLSDWRERLAEISELSGEERAYLSTHAVQACEAVGGGHWSVDLLQDDNGDWWLTDMALGDRSFKYFPDLERASA